MNTNQYLKRISFHKKITIDDGTLMQLHEHHVLHVPFENLDVHYGRVFDMVLENVFTKVVVNYRGGFCYELNSLFNTLLTEIGFKSRIIAARIIDEAGNVGPEYDHMCALVETDKAKYLADVGYGDLFVRPLEIWAGIQRDGRNLFKIEKVNDDDFILSMSSDQVNFLPKYRFSLREVSLEKFYDLCLDKQINPASYFVKNTVCTKATPSGRLTLMNNKLIEKKGNARIETLIYSDDKLRSELRMKFGVVIESAANTHSAS
jgi:N-hydroxyarylamine O-acetyltransferase